MILDKLSLPILLIVVREACMAGPRPIAISVSAPQQAVLERLLRQHTCPQALALRVRIVLGAATGMRNEPLAARLTCSPTTVRKWRARWAEAQARLAAAEADTATLATTVATTLADAARPGTPDPSSAEKIVQIVNLPCSFLHARARPEIYSLPLHDALPVQGA